MHHQTTRGDDERVEREREKEKGFGTARALRRRRERESRESIVGCITR